MEKYVKDIKDLVIQILTNGSEIKAKAKTGDALSCFQMGMIHLLGIDTPIDFNKASQYFENQSLADDNDANRILGFIAECEGNYSQAFKNYANAGKSNRPYINKVSEERVNLQSLFKKWDLPNNVQNKIVTNVLNEYIKEDDTKLDASIRIAMICSDEVSCLDAAQLLFDAGEYNSAMRWLQYGNISENNALYTSVKKKITDLMSGQNLPNTLEVVEINGKSFLANLNVAPSYAEIKYLCDEASIDCKKEWNNIVSSKVVSIKKYIKDEEATRIKKQKEEEAARIKKQKEEEAARIKKQKEEEAARIKKQKEEEQQALLEELKARRSKIYRRYNIIYGIISAPFIMLLIVFLLTDKDSFISNFVFCVCVFALFIFLPYCIIKWIIAKICKL